MTLSTPTPVALAPPPGRGVLGGIIAFEVRQQLRHPALIINVVLFVLLAFLGTTIDTIHVGDVGNGTHLNSAYALLQMAGILNLFAIAVPLRLFADTVLRDEESGMAGIVGTLPTPAGTLLAGRLLGALVAALAASTAPLWGVALGAQMWWVDPERLGGFKPLANLYTLAVMCLPTQLFLGGLFFAVAALTRRQMATYVAMIGLLVAYFISALALDNEHTRTLGAYLDPFGITPLFTVTRYWTVAERNTLLPPLLSLFGANRLIWGWAGIALFGLGVAGADWAARRGGAAAKATPKSAAKTADKTGGKGKSATDDGAVPAAAQRPVRQAVATSVDVASLLAMLGMRLRFETSAILRSPSFWILLVLSVLNMMGALLANKVMYDTPIYPVTRQMVDMIRSTFSVLPFAIAGYYTGELVWRERQVRLAEIIGATPAPGWVFSLSKFLSLAVILTLVWILPIVPAVVVQLVKGPVPVQPGLYLVPLLGVGMPTSLIMAALAVMVQVLSPNKFVGYAVMVVVLVLRMMAPKLGMEDNLLVYGAHPSLPLSDMNGYGHFLRAVLWFNVYWGCAAGVLLLLSHLMWPRATATGWRDRVQALRHGWSPITGTLAASLLAGMAASGGWIYHNTHVINRYTTTPDQEADQVAYEQTYRRYEGLPQPRVSEVQVAVDLDPAAQTVLIHGHYLVQNRTGQPLSDVHMTVPGDMHLDQVALEGAHLSTRDETLNYYIFTLDQPLAPGDTRRLDFATSERVPGFTNKSDAPQVVGNGSFVRSFESLPVIGFDPHGMLQDKFKRKKKGLPPIDRMPKLEDQSQWQISALGGGADHVRFDTVVSTDPDQTAIAPGRLEKDWLAPDANGRQRRYFHYVSTTPIPHFEAWMSARYAQAHDSWNGVDLDVFYHPTHEWNVARMMEGMKLALAYCSRNFSPFQYGQMRIIEFPDYAQFAQSFPNTVPYSEGIGFISDNRDPANIDLPLYVTAHEVAHQWWGHQVIPANVQGSTLPVETLAQYSALMVMEHHYGPNQIRKFLKAELDRYLSNRGKEDREEVPLVRVENQPYIHYRKGSLVMYALKDYLGEDTVNRALARLLRESAARQAGLLQGGVIPQDSRYTLSTDLVSALKAEAGPQWEGLISDMLEKIVLYDLKVVRSNAQALPDGRYKVALTVAAAKVEADGKGAEHAEPFTLPIDIGLFTAEPGKKDFTDADVIHLAKQPIHDGEQTIELVVDHKPTFVGIDPYNKLIDRNSEDNVAALGS